MGTSSVQLQAVRSALSLQEMAADALIQLAVQEGSSVAKALTDLMVVENVVEAQIALMRAADELVGTLLDLLA